MEELQSDIETMKRNYKTPHEHSFIGGEVLSVYHMPGEMDYRERKWTCQFCGVIAVGETLEYASKRLKAPEFIEG
jgi:hypothetical protein